MHARTSHHLRSLAAAHSAAAAEPTARAAHPARASRTACPSAGDTAPPLGLRGLPWVALAGRGRVRLPLVCTASQPLPESARDGRQGGVLRLRWRHQPQPTAAPSAPAIAAGPELPAAVAPLSTPTAGRVHSGLGAVWRERCGARGPPGTARRVDDSATAGLVAGGPHHAMLRSGL